MTLEHLRFLRDNFSDEIPDEVLSGKGDLKVRRNWWQGVIADLEGGVRQGLIPEELKGEVEEFLENYSSDEFHHQPLTTFTDIERANNLLDKILIRNLTPEVGG